MTEVAVELQRRNALGALVPWALNDDGTDPVADAIARQSLAAILTTLADVLVALQGIIDVDGTVDVGNLPAVQTVAGAVSVTNLPATQAVSDATTHADLGGLATTLAAVLTALQGVLTVAGTVVVTNLPAVQPVSGTVEVTNDVGTPLPVSGPVTDAQLRAAAILTDVSDRVARLLGHVAVDGTVDIGDRAGRLLGQVSAAALPLPAGASTEATVSAALDRLTTLRDTVFRRTDPLVTGANVIGYTIDSMVRKLEDGKVFVAGGKVNLTAAQTGTVSISNPVGSGKTVFVTRLELAADSNMDATYTMNPATVPGAAAAATNLNQGSATAAVGVVKAAVGSVTGGTTMSPVTRLGANATVPRDTLIALPPGKSYAVAVTAGVTAAFYAYLRWYEE